MQYEASEKFRAELYRSWSYIIGTPAGLLIIDLYLNMEKIQASGYLLAKLLIGAGFVAFALWISALSYRIMYEIDYKRGAKE